MKTYRIEKTKNVGNVIFVVEGGNSDTGGTELRLLKKIFSDVLGYEVNELRRGSDEFICHGKNPQYRVFALNLPKVQLTQLNEDALDALFVRLVEEFNIKPENCPIFYLYDRDVLSYHKNELRGKYVKRYTDPYGTDNGDQGQLLLSYPSIESFLVSCIEKETYKIACKLGQDAKNILGEKLKSEDNNDKAYDRFNAVEGVFTDVQTEVEKRLIHSVNEMDIGLETSGISSYDLDDLAPTLLAVYDFQQEKYNREDCFSFLSLVAMAFLELAVCQGSCQ